MRKTYLPASPAAAAPALGEHLRSLREAAGLTLRQVADRCGESKGCGISNGYLSLLERGRVQAPNPHVLHALAACYGTDYAELLRQAGYPLPGPGGGGAPPPIVFAGAERLTPEDREEIQEIITLKLRRRRQPR